jgi:hypothetical protein
MLMELHHRTMAATMIQSAWRARAERRAFAPTWEAHQRAKAEAAAAAAIQKVGHLPLTSLAHAPILTPARSPAPQ